MNLGLFENKAGCIQCVCQLLQWCQTLCNPLDCSQPGFSVHRILQVRILQCVAIFYTPGQQKKKKKVERRGERSYLSLQSQQNWKPPGRGSDLGKPQGKRVGEYSTSATLGVVAMTISARNSLSRSFPRTHSGYCKLLKFVSLICHLKSCFRKQSSYSSMSAKNWRRNGR